MAELKLGRSRLDGFYQSSSSWGAKVLFGDSVNQIS